MDGSDSVNVAGTDEAQIGHSNFLVVAFFNDGHSLEFVGIIWVFEGDGVHESLVDAIDEFQVSGEEVSHEVNTPFFEGLG